MCITAVVISIFIYKIKLCLYLFIPFHRKRRTINTYYEMLNNMFQKLLQAVFSTVIRVSQSV
jgi:Na+/proline symporter